MARMINVTTGADTARFGFRGTDLGFLTPTRHGYTLASFGDTFDGADPNEGGGWRSPVMLRTSNRDLAAGLRWDNAVGGARAKQVWDYRHVGENGTVNGTNFDAFTIIPNDVIHLPDGRYMGSGFRVKDWKSGGTQTMCHTLSNAWFYSDQRDAEVWHPARHVNELGRLYEWRNEGKNYLFQNVTLIMVDPTGETDPYVYAFGTPEGRTVGDRAGIYLRRVDWRRMWDDSAWQFWGWRDGAWQWGEDVYPTPILGPTLPGTTIGEINAQVIEGQVVLSYVDGWLGTVTRTAPRPDAVWTDPAVHITYDAAGYQYAPSLHPFSTLDEPYVHLSQWGDGFYGSKFWQIGPIERLSSPNPVPAPEGAVGGVSSTDSVEGTSTPTCTDLSALTVDELAEHVVSTTDVDPAELADAIARAAK